jgi:hypothetical protein
VENSNATARNDNPAREARRALNRFSRAVKKCQRELESMKKSLQELEGESAAEKDFLEFEQNFDSMLEFLNEKMRLMRESLLSSTMMDLDRTVKGKGGRGEVL